MSTVHVLLPDTVDDPRRPSGGNVYDRRVCAELAGLGWTVRELRLPAGPGLAAALRRIPDRALVLVDGLVAATAPGALASAADRLRVVVLVHLPRGLVSEAERAPERAVLAAVAGVVTTSTWTRDWLATEYGTPADRLRVAVPGTDPVALTPVRPSGTALLSVGALVPGKGHDLLVTALARLRDLPWACTVVGSPEVDPGYAVRLHAMVVAAGLEDRIRFPGPMTPTDLDQQYAAADLLVLPSRFETYGMVVTEALARGIPVVASDVGGVAEALGVTRDGEHPGTLVPSADADALVAAIAHWWGDPDHRARLRRAARARRHDLPRWPDTARVVDAVLRSARPESLPADVRRTG